MDLVILDGDKVVFLPTFGAALVVVRPGKIQASGTMTVLGKKVCLEGDESTVEVANCMYTAPPYVIPGMGTLKIKKLAGNQVAKKTENKIALILKGAMYTAEFSVSSQAKQPQPPGPPVPDPTPKYTGQGQFVTTNQKLFAT